MQYELLNTLPPWGFLILFTFFMALISTTLFLVIKHFFPAAIHNQTNDFLFPFMQVIGVGYAFLLGFIVISLWQSYDQMKKVTIEEANYLSLMTIDSLTLPPPTQDEIQKNIGQYIQNVINDEWITMKRGKQSESAFHSFLNLVAVVNAFTPQTEKEKIIYMSLVKNMDEAYKNRRTRINTLSSPLIPSLRFILIFNGLLLIVFISLLENKKKRVHLVFTLIASFVLFSNVGLALIFEHPFSGTLINHDPFSSGLLARYQKP
jgi:hypothetical protein